MIVDLWQKVILKELLLSEGRGNGISIIQDELRKNASGAPMIEINEERSYFLIEKPCREGVEDEPLNDKIKTILLKISELRITNRKDLHDVIKVSISTVDRILSNLYQ